LDARCCGIFVDAILPHPGESWLATAPPQLREHLRALARDGTLPQWNRWFPEGMIEALLPDASMRERFIAELPQIPIEYLEEHAPSARDDSLLGCGYVRISRSYEDMATQAEQLGWPVIREAADHLAILTRPEMVCAAILRLFEALDLGPARR
ncbi:MAG TPA: hypothetical protein VKR29_09675, partial [Candidatus Binataceae bacterium]|nr:hypothetical protein [Candidatus Binataceae bacterium]